MGIPSGGCRIQKIFAPLPGLLGHGALPRATLRIPVQGEAGRLLRVAVLAEGRERFSETFRLEAGRDTDWLEVPLQSLGVTDQGLTLTVVLTPADGRVSLAVDGLRDYGRTRVFDAAGRPQSLGFEAALELAIPVAEEPAPASSGAGGS